MLLYLYTLDYDKDITSFDDQDINDAFDNITPAEPLNYAQILDHVRVYTLADKLDIGDLKILAKAKFKAAVSGRWPLPQFPAIVHEIFTNTPSTDKGMRNIAIETCAEHIEELLDEEFLGDTNESGSEDQLKDKDQITWKTVIEETGDFATSLLTQIVKNNKAHSLDSIKNQLEDKLGPAGMEFSAFLNLASQSPQCCGGSTFHLHTVRGSQHSQPRLRLKCTFCHRVYRGF